MRILEVVPVFSDPFGGPVTVVRSISKELAKRHDVTVYTTTASDPKHDIKQSEEEVNGYKVYYFSRNFKQLIYSDFFGQVNISLSMRDAIKNHLKEFDVVHVHSYQQFPDIIVSFYANLYKIPYIVQVHGSLPKISRIFRKYLFDFFFGKRILFNATKVIALNEQEHRQYVEFGVSQDKIAIIPNSITPYNKKQYKKGTFRSMYNISNTEKVILYIGRIHETKRLDLLVKAFAIINRSIKSKLIIIGPDDGYLKTMLDIINQLHVSKDVMYLGYVNENIKFSAFRDSDVFVTPKYYGFPMTFLEACSMECPIITTSTELMWINQIGYIASQNEYSLAESIYTILTNENINKVFKNNTKKIIKQYESSVVSKKLESLYISILNKKN